MCVELDEKIQDEDRELKCIIDLLLDPTHVGQIHVDQVIERINELGFCLSILNDDNGHYAVTGDGFQNLPLSSDTQDITTSFFVKKDMWKNTIREALVYWAEKTKEDI